MICDFCFFFYFDWCKVYYTLKESANCHYVFLFFSVIKIQRIKWNFLKHKPEITVNSVVSFRDKENSPCCSCLTYHCLNRHTTCNTLNQIPPGNYFHASSTLSDKHKLILILFSSVFFFFSHHYLIWYLGYPTNESGFAGYLSDICPYLVSITADRKHSLAHTHQPYRLCARRQLQG